MTENQILNANWTEVRELLSGLDLTLFSDQRESLCNILAADKIFTPEQVIAVDGLLKFLDQLSDALEGDEETELIPVEQYFDDALKFEEPASETLAPPGCLQSFYAVVDAVPVINADHGFMIATDIKGNMPAEPKFISFDLQHDWNQGLGKRDNEVYTVSIFEKDEYIFLVVGVNVLTEGERFAYYAYSDVLDAQSDKVVFGAHCKKVLEAGNDLSDVAPVASHV